MTLYHITSGRYDDYGTLAFIEAPGDPTDEAVIREAVDRFRAACAAHHDLMSAVRLQARQKFQSLRPSPPEEPQKFSVLHPVEAGILSTGKTHVAYEQAKSVEQKFLDRRNSIRGQIEEHLRNQEDFVECEVARLIPVNQPITLDRFLPEGFKVVEVEEIHVRDV